MTAGYRYGPWHEGPDPLAPPYDVQAAVDRLGGDVLAGANPADALRRLLRAGRPGSNRDHGLDSMLRRVRREQRQLRQRGRLDGTLEEVRRLLDKAIGQERAVLFPQAHDAARLREAELDALPRDTARAVRELESYQWQSGAAAETFEEIRELLRSEVLDSQFRGLKDALTSTDERSDDTQLQRVKDMIADLNDMLRADARGEHTQEQFDEFLDRHGDLLPDHPRDLDELVDSLARRAAAAERLLQSLTPEQRGELSNLLNNALQDMDLAREMQQLGEALRARRPDLDWSSRARLGGDQPLGLSEGTSALQELADLEELEATLTQDYPGAELADIDEDIVARALGRNAVDDLHELRRTARELEEQGYLNRTGDRLELTAKAVRRLGQTALQRVLADLHSSGEGMHEVHAPGRRGELTGASRRWQFGDEEPLDVVRTLTNAVRRGGPTGGALRLEVDDFEVAESERRAAAAVCLLVDLSYSMVLRDTWGAAKSTALALHALVSGQFPQDALRIIGFSSSARVLTATELAGLDADYVQGTNLQHALMLAGTFLGKHADAEPVVLVVTDGEPTAHLVPGRAPYFEWPPTSQTIALTVAEVDRVTRRGATINVFQLDDEPRLTAFVQELARRNGGRVFLPDAGRLGHYVVTDYLQRRSGRGSRRAG